MSGERVFRTATWKTHMPFFDGQHLVFCVADGVRRYRTLCRGEIWTALDRRPGLRRSFLDLPRAQDLGYRPWKLAFTPWPGGPWPPDRVQRIETGLPAEAVECSPACYRDQGRWFLSFIGGVPMAEGWSYHLYVMSGPSLTRLDRAEKVSPHPARVGFVNARYVCLGGRQRLDLSDRAGGAGCSLECPLEVILRAGFPADDPGSVVVSGRDALGCDVTFVYGMDTGRTKEVASPSQAYKPSLYAGRVVFAGRRGRGLENRELYHAPCRLAAARGAIVRVEPRRTS